MRADLTSTATLIGRIQDGDRDARELLVQRCLPALRRWAHGRLPAYGRSLSDTDDLVQVTVYCSDVSLYETFNEVYQSYFVDERPRSCVHRLGRVALGDALRAPGDSGQTLSSGNPRHARSRPTLPRPSLRSMV